MYSLVVTKEQGILINQEFSVLLDNSSTSTRFGLLPITLRHQFPGDLSCFGPVQRHIHLVTESNYSHAIPNSCDPLTPQFLDSWGAIRKTEEQRYGIRYSKGFPILHLHNFRTHPNCSSTNELLLGRWAHTHLFIHFEQVSTSLFTLWA